MSFLIGQWGVLKAQGFFCFGVRLCILAPPEGQPTTSEGHRQLSSSSCEVVRKCEPDCLENDWVLYIFDGVFGPNQAATQLPQRERMAT